MTLPRYTPGPIDWRHLDNDGARELWVELAEWVQWLRERYDLGREIKACWFRHSPLVEELTAAMYAHSEAYQQISKNPHHGLAAGWHNQVLWPLVRRLKDVTSFEDCRPDSCGYRPTPAPINPGLAEFLAADIDRRPKRTANALGADTTGEDDESMTMDQAIELVDSGAATAVDPADDFTDVDIDGVRWTYDDETGAYQRNALYGAP